ncbi:MAG TPA: hypothetical protein VHW92_11840 [Mycobacteriales bacterium]|jgi:hypothetical protein|nr:hypothetical protein [Mycobacteriales bacterium]
MTSAIPQPHEEPVHEISPQQRELLEREDDVVQHLTVAKFALAIGDVAAANAAVDAALSRSRRTITDMVDVPASTRRAGKLVRTEPAAPVEPPAQRETDPD